MAVNPEREQRPSVPKEIETRAEDIPEEIEAHEGVKATRSQFTAKVIDDHGKPLTASPSTKMVTIVLPADDSQLTKWSKGSTDNAITWLGKFWLRMIKKAVHFSWKMVRKKDA